MSTLDGRSGRCVRGRQLSGGVDARLSANEKEQARMNGQVRQSAPTRNRGRPRSDANGKGNACARIGESLRLHSGGPVRHAGTARAPHRKNLRLPAAPRPLQGAGSLQTLDLRDRLSGRGVGSRAIWNLSESGIVPERRISLFLDGGEYANAC